MYLVEQTDNKLFLLNQLLMLFKWSSGVLCCCVCVCWCSGDSVAMDVATVFLGARFVKYNVSFLGYGFYGDCIVDSEANRWMGPKRYDWEGVT